MGPIRVSVKNGNRNDRIWNGNDRSRKLPSNFRLDGKRGHADCGQHCGQRTADCGHANKKIPYVSAFSTLVENADTLENALKMRKNVRIRKFLTCPHFPF